MTVVGPDGNLWSTGEPRVEGAVISIDVMPLGPAGTYTVNYRVTSADGHVVSGSWPFHLTTAGTGHPGPSAAAPANRKESRYGRSWPSVRCSQWGASGGRCAAGHDAPNPLPSDAIRVRPHAWVEHRLSGVQGQLVRATSGQWMTQPPTRCPNGHTLGPADRDRTAALQP